MCLNMGFVLVAYLHLESQNSKNMVDGHFAVAKRHIILLFLKKRLYVVAPFDSANVLTFDNGIKNTATDFV